MLKTGAGYNSCTGFYYFLHKPQKVPRLEVCFIALICTKRQPCFSRPTRNIRLAASGSSKLVDVTISVDSQINVIESHDITVLIEKHMQRKYNIHHVHILIEPLSAR
ncbi:cation transporter dimerization domain-containing protein [Paenibacillus sp. 1P07SE]|uniref:cation transporter dimerization domain-containing protein n=1 Tax=Paenibacillus sp. 1P07SE TaxID=3132209 RepID=UPI0039A5410C